MKSKAAAPSKRFYEDFEPECKWSNEEGRDIIELHVQGFKKDQLRVQASSSGALTVTGESPLDDRRWSRFRKEFKLPNKYKLNETRAKLAGGVLHVILLKERPPQAADARQEKLQTGGGLGRSGSGKPAAADRGGAWRDERRHAVAQGAVLGRGYPQEEGSAGSGGGGGARWGRSWRVLDLEISDFMTQLVLVTVNPEMQRLLCLVHMKFVLHLNCS
ncbi:hypothetical protein NL676_017152 [Syzygium grande]|nr:hypothetical protein NL676_017152 [Syzygium grande]